MSDRNITEEQARALWERAARLQAEAAATDLVAISASDEAPEETRDASQAYSVDVVRKSAVEAGISAEFIEKALEEMGPSGEAPGRVDRWADAYLGGSDRVLRVRRTIEESPERIYGAMGRVLPNRPYGLTLSSTDGKSPVDGGVLTFEVPYGMGMGVEGAATSKAIMNIRHWADIKELQVRLTPVEGPDGVEHTEVEIWANLAHSRRVNFWVGNTLSGVVGAAGGIVAGAIAGAIINPAVTAEILMTLGIAGTGGLGAFFGTGRAWRPMYRFAMRKGKDGLEKLVDALVVDLHTGGAFASRPEVPGANGPVSGMLKDLGL